MTERPFYAGEIVIRKDMPAPGCGPIDIPVALRDDQIQTFPGTNSGVTNWVGVKNMYGKWWDRLNNCRHFYDEE